MPLGFSPSAPHSLAPDLCMHTGRTQAQICRRWEKSAVHSRLPGDVALTSDSLSLACSPPTEDDHTRQLSMGDKQTAINPK